MFLCKRRKDNKNKKPIKNQLIEEKQIEPESTEKEQNPPEQKN
jgi:hypothetical protein